MASRRPATPTIRQYRPGDDAQVRALADTTDLSDIATAFQRSGGDFLVAEVEGVIVGTAGLLVGAGQVGEIVQVRVRSGSPSESLGTALLEAVEQRAVGLGLRRLTLDLEKNQPDAVECFVASGFHADEDGESARRGDLGLLSKALRLLP